MITNFKIFEKVSDYNIAHMAACNNEYIVDLLINNNVDINVIEPKGAKRTALINAIRNLNVNMVKKLIKAGANVNIQDIFGNTPLIYSVYNLVDCRNDNCKNKCIEIIKTLNDNEADWNIRNSSEQDIFDIIEDHEENKYSKINIGEPTYHLHKGNKQLLIDLFPDKYEEYEMKKDIKNFNL